MTAMGSLFDYVKRLVAWISLLGIGVLSLLPTTEVGPLRTGIGGHFEHLLAYAATTLIVMTAYLDLNRIKIAVSLIVYAAALEYLQRFAPGRGSSLLDFTFSAAGVVIALAALYALRHLWDKRVESRDFRTPSRTPHRVPEA